LLIDVICLPFIGCGNIASPFRIQTPEYDNDVTHSAWCSNTRTTSFNKWYKKNKNNVWHIHHLSDMSHWYL